MKGCLNPGNRYKIRISNSVLHVIGPLRATKRSEVSGERASRVNIEVEKLTL